MSTWFDIAHLCPIQCEVSHITEEDYKDVVVDGKTVRRAHLNFVPGLLTVIEESHGRTFFHPGFKEGKISIHAFNSDMTPMSKGITIRRVQE